MHVAWVGLVALSLIAVMSTSAPRSLAQPATASTDTGVWGDFIDVLIDEGRDRLYVTDVSTFHEQGVVVLDLATHVEIARIPILEASGLALSPDGSLLAVGSLDGFVALVDPDRLEVVQRATILNGYFLGNVWDVAFSGNGDLWVTLAQLPNTAGGTYPVIILDANLQELARFDEGLYGFSGSANVEIDGSRGRAYVLTSSFGWVYDASQTPPVKLAERIYDYNLTQSAILSPDGRRLFFSTGSVYDALTFSPAGSIGGAGSIALDPARGALYLADGPFLHRRSLSDYSLLETFGFRGRAATGYHIRSVVVDSGRNAAVVVSEEYLNSETVHVVPLVPAVLDPWPADGALLAFKPNGVSVVLSGGVDPSSVRMVLDGSEVPAGYDPATLMASYSSIPFGEGLHRASVAATGPSGEPLSVAWSFDVDSFVPEILVDSTELEVTTPHATISGRILEPHLAGAWIDERPLPVDPSDGSFRVRVDLATRTTAVVLRAEDTLGRSVSVIVRIHYAPEKDPLWSAYVALSGLAGAGAGASGVIIARRVRAARKARGAR